MKTVHLAQSGIAVLLLTSSFCLAQTPAPPQNSTNPSSASSPSQREATQKPSTEAPTSSASQPSAASTPHQRETMKKPQSMAECMEAQAAHKPSLSKEDMTKACNEQMKGQKKDR